MTFELRYLEGFDPSYIEHEIKPWLEEAPFRQAIVLEENPSVLFQWDQDHPRLHLRLVPHKRAWNEVLEACAAEFPYTHVDVRSKKPHLRLKILRKTAVWHAKYSEALGSGLFYANILRNFPRLPSAFSVSKWKGAFAKIPAIICGAGPSLEKTIPTLKTLTSPTSRAFILAGGSTLSALSHFGVRPHLGLAIDPNAREYEAIRGCQFRDLPLLYCNRVLPRVFEHFQGPYGYIRGRTGGTIETFLEEQIGLQDDVIGPELGQEALSVTTMAVAIAYALGCDPIILAGVDLAFSNQKMYAPGIKTPAPEESSTEKRVFRKGKHTLVRWVMESDTLSRFAKARLDRTWIDASEGLGFKGVSRLPLHQIPFPNLYPIQDQIASLIQKNSSAVSSSQISQIYHTLEESLYRCKTLCQKILEVKGERRIIFEIDLVEEPAYKALLEVAAFAYDRLVGENRAAFLLECIENHLATLKFIAQGADTNA